MRLFLNFSALLLLTLPLLAAAPSTIGYQGVLTDGSNQVVSDGSHSLTFNLYTAASGGSSLWTETQSVTTTRGVFTAVLGSSTALSVSFEQSLWLGISVDGGSELSPRVQLSGVPYSMTAQGVADNAITSAKISDGTVASADITDGTITAADIASAQVVKSVNSLADAVTLAAGSNVTITPSGNTLTIAASASGGNSLDQAYDQGGSGVGRTITADNGAVDIQGTGGLTVTGNVGIGTSAPAQLLDVRNNTAGAGAKLRLDGDNGASDGGSGVDLFYNNVLKWSIFQRNMTLPHALAFSTGSMDYTAAKMVIEADGDVGIGTGTGSPDSRLLIKGGGNTSGTSALHVRNSDNNSVLYVRDDQRVSIGMTSPDARLVVQGAGNTSSTVALKVNNSDASPLLHVLDDGKVGIGTNAPAQWLDVRRNISGGGARLRLDGGNGASDGGAGVDLYYNGGIKWSIFERNQSPSHALAFATGAMDYSTAKLLIEADGDVGVGTGNSTLSTRFIVKGGGNTSGTSALNVQNSDGTSSLYVRDDGNVGIGTTSPSDKMHVKGDIFADGGNLLTSNGTNTLTLSAGGLISVNGTPIELRRTGSGSLQVSSDITITPASGAASTTFLGTSGNVGIGISTPAKRLTLKASADNTMDFILEKHDETTQIVRIGQQSGDGVIGIYDSGVNSFNHWLEGNDGSHSVLAMLASSRLGIGTNTPGEKLDVETSSATVAAFNRTTDDGTIISLQQDGTEEGTISVATNTVSYNAFTGSHYAWVDESIEMGMLVTLTGDNRRLHDEPESEILYGIAPSTKANDPAILGAYLQLQEPTQPASADNPHLIMAVGNGAMWVAANGEDIEIGDYLVSADLMGHAMKDPATFETSYIVARAAERVQWSEVEQAVGGRKHAKISVFFESFTRHNAQRQIENLQAENQQLKSQLNDLAAAVARLEALSAQAENGVLAAARR